MIPTDCHCSGCYKCLNEILSCLLVGLSSVEQCLQNIDVEYSEITKTNGMQPMRPVFKENNS